MHVLLVEDETAIRQLVRELFEETGFLCTAASDAGDALGLVDQAGCAPDVLVTDFHLGSGRNGRELAQDMQRRLPGLPTIYVTGNPECILCHALQPQERLLAKPFGFTALLGTIHALRPRGVSWNDRCLAPA